MKRNFIKTSLIIVALFWLPAYAGDKSISSVKNVKNDRPNIIVIYTDDQGFGDASCLNPEAKFKTPNLDRLANEGVSFTNAHSSDTVCTPSRYGLLTGAVLLAYEKEKRCAWSRGKMSYCRWAYDPGVVA